MAYFRGRKISIWINSIDQNKNNDISLESTIKQSAASLLAKKKLIKIIEIQKKNSAVTKITQT